jgi:hypothetical protein
MGKITGFVIKRWKLLLNLTTLIAVIIALYIIRHDLVTTFRNLTKVNAWFLVLMVPLELLNYHSQARLYQRLFKIVGNKLSYRYLFLASLELNFVNHVFPSGGAAGLSYFGFRIKNDEITGGRATLIQIMKLALTFISFEILIIMSVFFLAVGNRVNDFTILVAGVMSTMLLVGSVLFAYIVGKRERINTFLEYVTKSLNKLIRRFRPVESADAIDIQRAKRVFEDFHYSYTQIKKSGNEILPPLLYALLCNLTEVAVVYVVFLAFGHVVNLGAVILAYGIANFAGMISILPGGIGIYEALMTAVLLATGVSATFALPVIIMYRVLNTLLQISPGYYLYQKNISKQGNHKSQANKLTPS